MSWEDIMKDDKILNRGNKSFIDKYEEKMDLEKTIWNLRKRIFKAYQQFQEDLPDEILNEKELIGLFREIVLERIDTLGGM